MNREANEIALLEEASVHTVISILLHRFISDKKLHPEIIFLNNNLRMQFTLELIKLHGFSPDEAVVEPVWIQGFGRAIPLLYSATLGEDYVRILNRSALVSDSL